MRRRMLGGILAVVPTLACWEGESTFEDIELGVDVRLNAVEANYDDGFIAIGSEGTVVRDDGFTWDLGEVDLHDIQYDPQTGGGFPALWFVVGDAGTIFVGRQARANADLEWRVQETGTTANLFGVALLDWITPIVVGDEVVLIGQPADELGMFEWTPEPAPPSGWGRLRDVEVEEVWNPYGTDEVRIWTAGLQGRIWLVDGTIEEWLSLDAGTDEDLLDVDHNRFCGTRGTIVTCGDEDRDWDECIAERVADADFVACNHMGMLGSDRRIYLEGGRGSYLLGWQPRGIDESDGNLVVGDRGHAGRWRPYFGYDL